jgi:hypothetical protein
MSDIEHFQVTNPNVTKLLDLLREDREVVSIFLKPKSRRWPESHGNPDGPLAWLLGSDEFRSLCPEVGGVKRASGRYSTLNRLELEGSLTSTLLEGGCHGSSLSLGLDDARRHVSAGIDSAFPAPFDSVCAYRLDDQDWCDFTGQATIWSTHVAWEGARSLLWLICTRDID